LTEYPFLPFSATAYSENHHILYKETDAGEQEDPFLLTYLPVNTTFHISIICKETDYEENITVATSNAEKFGHSCVVCSNSSAHIAYALQHNYMLLFPSPPTGHDSFSAQDRPEALYHLFCRQKRGRKQD